MCKIRTLQINTNDEQDVAKETTFAGLTLLFAPGTHPTSKNSVYETDKKIVMAMMNYTMPTLHVHGGEYANLKELKLKDVCPVQFPFGLGGPVDNRETPISPEETYKHYCRLSLRQFMRGDVLLVLKHMHNHMLSFKRACISAKSSAFDSTLGGEMAEISMTALKKAATLADLGKQVGDVAGRLIKTLKGTSRSSGYSKESAKFHHRQHWALCDYFGFLAIFLTITPCDECVFCVRSFADADNPHVLPKLLIEDPFSKEATDICDVHFTLRSKQRKYNVSRCMFSGLRKSDANRVQMFAWMEFRRTGRRRRDVWHP